MRKTEQEKEREGERKGVVAYSRRVVLREGGGDGRERGGGEGGREDGKTSKQRRVDKGERKGGGGRGCMHTLALAQIRQHTHRCEHAHTQSQAHTGGLGVRNGCGDPRGEGGSSDWVSSLMKGQLSCLSLPWTGRCLWL